MTDLMRILIVAPESPGLPPALAWASELAQVAELDGVEPVVCPGDADGDQRAASTLACGRGGVGRGAVVGAWRAGPADGGGRVSAAGVGEWVWEDREAVGGELRNGWRGSREP